MNPPRDLGGHGERVRALRRSPPFPAWRVVLLGAWLALNPLGSFAAEAAAKTAADFARDLESSDRKLRREAAYELSRLGKGAKVALPQLIAALDDEQQQVWFGAISALANLGPEAEPALPALIKELKAWTPFRKDRQGSQALYRTSLALGAVGAPAVPLLVEQLKNDAWFVRAGAAKALGFAGTAAQPAAVPLAALLSDERPEAREAAAESLAILGSVSLPPVTEILRRAEEPRARAAAADTLRRLGTNAAPALPTLQTRLREERSPEVRGAILQALARTGLPAPELVGSLFSGWDDESPVVRDLARRELLLVRPAASVVVPALIPRLQVAAIGTRVTAADLLAEFGAEARAAVPALVAGAQGATNPAERATMAAALAAIGRFALAPVLASLAERPVGSLGDKDWELQVLRRVDATSVAPLGEALGHPSATVRAAVLEGLAGLGDRARPVAKRLLPLLDDPEPGVRSRAWEAAASCGVSAEALLPKFETALGDPAPAVPRAAVRSLGRFGKGAAPVVGRLVKVWEGADADLRGEVLATLGRLGTEAAPAVEVLANALPAAGASDQVLLLRTLGRIGASAVPGLGRMLEASRSSHDQVRAAFAEAAAGLGKEGKDASTRLDELTRDPVPAVRAGSLTALVRVAPESAGTVTNLLVALEDPELVVRTSAAAAVARLEERGRPAEPRLFTLLASEPDRESAKNALKAIHPVGVEALMGVLEHADWTVREMAADGLARLGKDATNAIPALEKAMRDDRQEEVKRASRRALRRIREG